MTRDTRGSRPAQIRLQALGRPVKVITDTCERDHSTVVIQEPTMASIKVRGGVLCMHAFRYPEAAMAKDERDILEVLRFELNFLEQGGYGRSVRTPWKPTSIFQDSVSCINFNDPERPHPCNECLLTQFVPGQAQDEAIPCHHIPLNANGETVDSMERTCNQAELEEAVRNWLRAAIRRLEQERARKSPSADASNRSSASSAQ